MKNLVLRHDSQPTTLYWGLTAPNKISTWVDTELLNFLSIIFKR